MTLNHTKHLAHLGLSAMQRRYSLWPPKRKAWLAACPAKSTHTKAASKSSHMHAKIREQRVSMSKNAAHRRTPSAQRWYLFDAAAVCNKNRLATSPNSKLIVPARRSSRRGPPQRRTPDAGRNLGRDAEAGIRSWVDRVIQLASMACLPVHVSSSEGPATLRQAKQAASSHAPTKLGLSALFLQQSGCRYRYPRAMGSQCTAPTE